MTKILFKAFFSCSFTHQDEEIINFFKKIIRSFDIEPEIYDYQEIGRMPDKVDEHIRRSDCLIAIATRRKKIEDSDYWACPDWIQHEIAVAHAYRKPIAIFVEEGVKIEGLIEMEQRWQTFVRDDLTKNIDKITTFLFNLRDYLETAYQTERIELPLLLRHYIHAKEEMLSRELTVLRCEILMESLVPELEATYHLLELEDTTPGLSIKSQGLDFICKERPSGVNVEPVIVQNTDYKFLWKVIFDPPLKKGEKVKYAFKRVRPNYRPYTYEEALERIKQGTYEYKEPICEACEYYLSYPTVELFYDFEFPEGYEIKKYHVDVKVGEKVRLKAETERKRIQEGNFFTAEKIFDKWTLSLKVPKPIQGHIYYTYYEPPKASELK
ncbi:TIR domain-containing protein [Dehalococcoidia bacterium]|nr:TIR domain-containing protein [Dehalococcoidia bacterium]